MTTSPHAARFEPLDDEGAQRWQRYLRPDRLFFPTHVGLLLEEVRRGYARVRLPLRPEVLQVAGLLHGGAIATMIDTVAVPAVATAYDRQPDMVTVSMTVNFTGAIAAQDAIAEAWVEQSGSSLAFVRVEASGADDGRLAATASLVFRIRPR